MIDKITTANLRRTQAFDSELRSAKGIDKIAEELANAILFQTDSKKRKVTIDRLIGQIVDESKTTILPQAEKIGQQNAIDVLSIVGNPVDLNDPAERATALFKGRNRYAQRLEIIRGSIDAKGGELNAALNRYWLEPSEGTQKDKVERLRKIHNDLEKKRKDYEKNLRDFTDGKIKRKPNEPNLDFMSAMTLESKKTIRQQARRAGTDAEVTVFQAKGYKKFIWITPNGASACPDCRNRQSVVLTIPEWERIGRPGSGQTVCNTNCFCMLLPAEAALGNTGIITGQHSRIAGPLTSEDDLAILNANRVASTKGVVRQTSRRSSLLSDTGDKVEEDNQVATQYVSRGPNGKDLGNPDEFPDEESIRKKILGIPEKQNVEKAKETIKRANELTIRFNSGDKSVLEQAKAAIVEAQQQKEAIASARELSRDEAFKAISVEDGARVKATSDAHLDNANTEARRANAFMKTAISKDAAPDSFAIKVQPRGTRAHASPIPGEKTMFVAPEVSGEIIAHEFGHIIESESGPHFKAAVDFLARRAKGEKPRKLSEITGNKKYKDKERAIEDEFANPYVGKIYEASGNASHKGLGASEITSMGIENLMRDPVAFAKDDPDFFRFTLAQLRRKAGPRV